MKHQDIQHLVIILLFFGMLWLPLAKWLLAPSQTHSEQEKRMLAPRPTLSLRLDDLLQFPGKFEEYYNDHFGFRDQLIRAYHRLRLQVFKVAASSRVLVGGDGWLFQTGGPHLDDMRNNWPFSEDELRHWGNVLAEKQETLARQNIRYLFVIAPSKHTVYPEYLPGSVKMVRKTSRVDQLVEYLEEHTKVNVLDLRPAMLKAKKTLPTHHQTDTHWNSWGAYVGYAEIMKKVWKWFPKAPLVKLHAKDFVYREEPGGDLAVALNMSDVLMEKSVVLAQPLAFKARYLTPGDHSPKFLNKNPFATATDSVAPRALVFRDSYSLALMDYLSESFSYIYYVPRSPAAREYLYELVKEQHPDVVIEERASRWLRTPEG